MNRWNDLIPTVRWRAAPAFGRGEVTGMADLWVSTEDFLPDSEELVLIISKFGHISESRYTDMGMGGEPLFRPDGLKAHTDVKWWMVLPIDGWHDIKTEKPAEREEVLILGMYGEIYNCRYEKGRFVPFVFPCIMWREMPSLPEGASLKYG